MKPFPILAILAILTACSPLPEGSGDLETSPEAAALAGISALSGAVGALQNLSLNAAFAQVTTCSAGAISDSCSAGVKAAVYSKCPIGATGLSYSGTVTLTFSDSNCAFSNYAHTITRTVDLTRTGTSASRIHTTSATHADYSGGTHGGGTRLFRNVDGSSTLDILGIRKVKSSSNGITLFDTSVYTTSSVSISNPAATSTVVSGGNIQVAHNLAAYTASLTPSNLVYDFSTCCYPLSGTMNLTYAGSVTGTASIQFDSTCGNASFTRNGNKTNITLIGCQ